MSVITFLIYEAVCPHCGASHSVPSADHHRESRRDGELRELRKGDRVPLADFREAEFFEVNEWKGGDLENSRRWDQM